MAAWRGRCGLRGHTAPWTGGEGARERWPAGCCVRVLAVWWKARPVLLAMPEDDVRARALRGCVAAAPARCAAGALLCTGVLRVV